MKLFYCPTYSGFVYTNLKENGILFDTKIVDSAALVDLLKMHAGLHSEKKDEIKRAVNYYKAIKQYIKKNPESIMKSSFELDGLSVAKKCLSWRDALAFAGWTEKIDAPTERMKFLSGVEKYFSDKSIGEEIIEITAEIKNGCPVPNDLKIIVPIKLDFLSPIEKDLLDALKEKATIIEETNVESKNESALGKVNALLTSNSKDEINLPEDKSFEIIQFEERDDALRYLSQISPNDYDVWINKDNKAFDNWLSMESQPVSGSRIQGGLPQIAQTLMIGIQTFERPLNIENLIEWLSIPLSPLKTKFRKRLAQTIAEKCGYYNDECRKIIEDFLNDDFENEFTDFAPAEREKKIKLELKQRKYCVEKFLPDINNTKQKNGTVNIDEIKSFTKNLYTWCMSELSFFNDGMEKIQLAFVKNQCEALTMLLEDESNVETEYSRIENLVSGLDANVSLLQYEAEEGCRTIINMPGQLCGTSKNTIWCDFYNEDQVDLKYSFLLPKEKEMLSKTLKLWSEENERNYNKAINLLPFTKTKEKLTLVVINKIGMDSVQKHPVIICLEKQIKNLDWFIKSPSLEKNLFSAPEYVENGIDANQEFVKITQSNLIKWPNHESPSTFENLIYNPFDYVFSNLAHINSIGMASIPDFQRIKGNVAHAVIEEIFNQKEEIPESGKVTYIEKQIKENFDDAFNKIINARGAIFLLKENTFELNLFKDDVFDCVNNVLKILKENNLEVLSCEQHIENPNLHFLDDINVSGYADMILKNENGDLLVFDFKWTGNENKYITILEENRSIQLMLYKNLISTQQEKSAKSSAYILLPKGKIISTDKFNGDCKTVEPNEERDTNLMEELKRSYEYRKKQISDGNIEEAEGLLGEQISYAKDTESKKLLPLKFEDDGTKSINGYSNYKCFKEKN